MSCQIPSPCAKSSLRNCLPSSQASASATSASVQQWRRQIGCRTRWSEQRGPRPFVLVGYRNLGANSNRLVPLEQLQFLALFDERTEDHRLETRILSFRASIAHSQLHIGGPEQNLFEKNVRLPPSSRHGRHLDPMDVPLIEIALGWERYLERVNRHPHFPRRERLRWPAWWCAVTECPDNVSTRSSAGQQLVAWDDALANHLSFTTVYADLQHLPRRQIVACDDPVRALCGHTRAMTFDLYHSRFRRAA